MCCSSVPPSTNQSWRLETPGDKWPIHRATEGTTHAGPQKGNDRIPTIHFQVLLLLNFMEKLPTFWRHVKTNDLKKKRKKTPRSKSTPGYCLSACSALAAFNCRSPYLSGQMRFELEAALITCGCGLVYGINKPSMAVKLKNFILIFVYACCAFKYNS